MKQDYTIPADADRATLAAIHNEILAVNPSIRVMSRWGSFTEYSVKLQKRDVERLLGRAVETGSWPWRLVWGVDAETASDVATTVDIHVHDGDDWSSIHDEITDDDPLIERAISWLREQHPAAEALVEIDRRLLVDGHDLR